MTPERVFDGDRLRAVLFRGRSDRLVATFDYRSDARSDGRAGFSDDTHSTNFARQGFSQLAVKTRANDWFVNQETPALEEVLKRATLGHGRVQALGFSMGGYGALRFARALGATQVVVVSPQLSPHVPWDARYRTEAAGWDPAIGDLAHHAAPGLRGLLLFDPFVPEDRLHALAIQRLVPGLRLVRLGFGGHPAIRTLRGAGGMRVLWEAAGARRARAAPIASAHRAARAGSAGWWLRLAAHAEGRRPGLAAKARDRAAALPNRPGDADPAPRGDPLDLSRESL